MAGKFSVTYPQAIQFLYGLQVFGANLGLERAEKLAALAGNPEKKLRFIHVAGTNGKGSTCAMLESIYRAAGLRVGLFTSPHLVSFRERIQINRQLISETEIIRLVEGIQPLLKNFSPDNHPTMFEFVTVMALNYFAEQKCDLVIWETGLGGRLDATNIVTPLASVITNIALDHTQWLGDTLAKIATEKAGIIKPNAPIITAETNAEPLAVIKEIAREKNAELKIVRESGARSQESGALLGEHQRQNTALALATVSVLQKHVPVTDEQITNGLATVNWPGRLQLIQRGAQKFLLDGAHNLAGVATLKDALQKNFPIEKPTLILGILGDKDWRAMCESLAPLATRVLLVPVGSERTTTPEELAAICRSANPSAEILCCPSLETALRAADSSPFTVIAGSLYLIGEALALLDPAFLGKADERKLNDWKATPAPGATEKQISHTNSNPS